MPQKSNEPEMIEMIQAIVGGETPRVKKLLSAHPHLAQTALNVGATRQQAIDWFFEEICHYLYGGDTGLHAAAAAYNADIAELLLLNGADIRARNRRGAEAIHYASDGGPMVRTWDSEKQERMVTLLISSGANPNAVDKSGVAPLHRAVRTRSTGAVRALVAGGSNVRLKNGNGSTPLHLAVRSTGRGGSGSPESKVNQMEIIELLLKNGANPGDKDAQRKTVKQWINEEAISSLLSRWRID